MAMVKNFSDALTGVRKTLASIDALTAQAGEHFNEAQIERAVVLLDFLQDELTVSREKAFEALNAEPIEPEPLADNVVGQTNQLDGPTDKITADAAQSIEDAFELSRRKDKPNDPGVLSIQDANPIDKAGQPGAATVGIATSEGDIAIHHTEDGSREIYTSSPTEAVKILTPDVAVQQSAIPSPLDTAAVESVKGNEAQTFTPAIDADKPADPAAVLAGAGYVQG